MLKETGEFFKPELRKFILPLILIIFATASLFYFGVYCTPLMAKGECTKKTINSVIQIALTLGLAGYIVSCVVFQITKILEKSK